MHIGGSGSHRMNQLCPAVYADMGLHAEMPLVALLGLMHLRIPLLLAILRGTGGIDNGGIHNGPAADLQALLRQIFSNPHKELFAYVMSLQQMPKLTDGRLVGHRLAAQIDADKMPHGTGGLQRIPPPPARQTP